MFIDYDLKLIQKCFQGKIGEFVISDIIDFTAPVYSRRLCGGMGNTREK